MVTKSAPSEPKPSKSRSTKSESTAPVKALYRKYRPTSLDDIVGQEQITTPLKNSLKQGKISHAYLFIGPRGTGKTSVARIFAHAINNFDYQLEDSYLDIVEIDAASNTGVDNIRELREKAIIAPTKGKYKVYIIDEVHMLTKSAANALLKTLEEPPEHVVFIMATTDAYKVPVTISSRTQVHTFRLADPEIMKNHLKKIADAEKIPIEDAALELVVRRGGGSFRDSLSILDQITSLSDQTITAELLEDALGLPQAQALTELLTAYANADADKIHDLLKDLLNTGIKPETIASELISTIIERPDSTFLPLLAALPNVQPPFSDAKLLLALLQNLLASPSAKPISRPSAPVAAPKAPEPASKSEAPSHPTSTGTAPKPAENAPESKTVSAPTPKSAPEPPQKPADSESPQRSFSWDSLLQSLRQDHDALYLQLQKTEHEFDGQTLQIYPSNKFSERVLKRADNVRAISDALDSIELIIRSANDHPATQAAKDPTISQISAIMGDVKEIDADMPF